MLLVKTCIWSIYFGQIWLVTHYGSFLLSNKLMQISWNSGKSSFFQSSQISSCENSVGKSICINHPVTHSSLSCHSHHSVLVCFCHFMISRSDLSNRTEPHTVHLTSVILKHVSLPPPSLFMLLLCITLHLPITAQSWQFHQLHLFRSHRSHQPSPPVAGLRGKIYIAVTQERQF